MIEEIIKINFSKLKTSEKLQTESALRLLNMRKRNPPLDPFM